MDFDSLDIPPFVDKNLFKEYLQIRKTLKAPNTSRVITRLINKLKLANDKNIDTNLMIINSITNGWKDIYEPRIINNNFKQYKTREQKTDKFLDDFFDNLEKQNTQTVQAVVNY